MESLYPLRLDHAGAWRVYLGGKRIRMLRGAGQTEDDHYPEEWIASVTPATGAGAADGAGLSRLAQCPDLLLRDVIESDPQRFLGRAFVQEHGSHCGVLMKLLDAAERLNVQVHPDRAEARRLWGSPFGKVECWHFLQGQSIGGAPPVFYLGLKEHVTPAILRAAFESRDPQRLLACMHAFEAVPGQTVLVNGGVPHALGAGCLVLEIQEPSDLTLRLERRTASGSEVPDQVCHMGIGYDAMFSLIQYPRLGHTETLAAYTVAPRVLYHGAEGRITCLLDYAACPYFRMERVEVFSHMELPPSGQFYGLFVLAGTGELFCGERRDPLVPGEQFFIPADCPAIRCAAGKPLHMIRFSGPQTSGRD